MTYEKSPRVYLFGTGGTISFVGESRTDFANYSYRGRQLTIQEMLARVPEAESLAEVLTEQVINVGSTEVYPEHWITLANRINETFTSDPSASGVAVTHGTATSGRNGLLPEPYRSRPKARRCNRRYAASVCHGH